MSVNVWGIHMGAHVGSSPIEKGYVAIGWDDIGDLSILVPTRDAFKAEFTRVYPQEKTGAVPVKAGVLYRFVHEMQVGDIVVYPSKNDRMVNIGTVSGCHTFDNSGAYEYPNYRTVEWLAHIPRDEFPQAALNEIGSAITLFSITRFASEFLKRISQETIELEGSDQTDSEDDETATGEVSNQAVETTHDFIIRKLKLGLDPYQFEEFTAHVLECMGYTARVTQASGDGGVDVIAHKDELGFEPPIIKVQCKQITGTSSEPEVNRLLGTLGEGEFALFVNLGSYTNPARLLERNRSRLRLIDGKELVTFVLENYERLAPKYRTLLPLRQIYVPDI